VRYWNSTGVKRTKHGVHRFGRWELCQLGSDLIAVRKVVAIINVRGINDFPGVISLRGVGLGILVGSNRLVLKEARRDIWDKAIGSNAKNLSRVDIVAVLVDVGVVAGKLGRIESVRGLNPITCITWLHNVGGCAVGAIRTQAERLTGHQIVTSGVNVRVDGHNLIRGCALSGADGVASVPVLDSVVTNAITRGCGNTLSEEWKNPEGSNDDRSEHGGMKRVWGCCGGCIPTGVDRSKQF
jgi:hypothetical protein